MRHILTITRKQHSGECTCGWTASNKSEDVLVEHYDDHLRAKGLLSDEPETEVTA